MAVISTGNGGDMSPSLFKILFVSPPLFNRKNHAYLLFASRKILAKNVNWAADCRASIYIKNKKIKNFHRQPTYVFQQESVNNVWKAESLSLLVYFNGLTHHRLNRITRLCFHRVTRCPALCGTVTHFNYFLHVPQIETLSRIVIESQTRFFIFLKYVFYNLAFIK